LGQKPAIRQTFTYDALNRIATAAASTYAQSSTHCWGESFTIDQYGNLTSIGVISADYNGCTQDSLSVAVSSTTNRITTSGYCYDSAGNLLGQSDCFTYEYDAENQLIETAGVVYTYDGDGKRVKKDQTSGSTYDRLYWYDLGINPLAETDLSGNTTNEYIFLGGARVARQDSSNVYYYFADHLGTSRTIVQAGQTSPCYDADFYPYGGERLITNTCSQTYKFTGKERDGESGLDYAFARFYNARLGRFMSGDPLGGDIGDPQSLNRYSYVLNDPINLIDPTGMNCYDEEGVVDFRRPGCVTSDDDDFCLGCGGPLGVGEDDDDSGAFRPAPCYYSRSCPQESRPTPQHPVISAPPPAPRPVPTISADPNWFHSRQAQCVGEGFKEAVKDLAHVDLADAVVGVVVGDVKPVGALATPGNAAWAAERGVKYVANNRGVVISIRETLREEGHRVSGNAIARGARFVGRSLAAVGVGLAGISGYDAYKTCMNN
jgi:RHS repeat-associated protein